MKHNRGSDCSRMAPAQQKPASELPKQRQGWPDKAGSWEVSFTEKVQVVQVSCHLHTPLGVWDKDHARWLWEMDPGFWGRMPEETPPYLLPGAKDQWLGVEQTQLPCRPTETPSNFQETETRMIELHAMAASPKPSFRGTWRVGNGQCPSQQRKYWKDSGCPCQWKNCSWQPPAEKTERQFLLHHPSCSPRTIWSGKGLNWPEYGTVGKEKTIGEAETVRQEKNSNEVMTVSKMKEKKTIIKLNELMMANYTRWTGWATRRHGRWWRLFIGGLPVDLKAFQLDIGVWDKLNTHGRGSGNDGWRYHVATVTSQLGAGGQGSVTDLNQSNIESDQQLSLEHGLFKYMVRSLNISCPTVSTVGKHPSIIII